MDCDICGKKDASFIIQVEGARMAACKGCAYHGKILLALEEEGEEKGSGAKGRGSAHDRRLGSGLAQGLGGGLAAGLSRQHGHHRFQCRKGPPG